MLTEYAPLSVYADRYVGLAMVPCRVICDLVPGARVVSYDPVNLDNLLARLVLEEATGGDTLMAEPRALYRLPVPLATLWQSDEGLPLYACTPLAPEQAVADVAYIHKRAQSGEFTGTKSGVLGMSTTNGRWMERRIPFPTTVCARLVADVVGNPEEIARLLHGVTFIGKRRGCGFGEVRGWRVEAGETWTWLREGRLLRNLPEAARDLVPPDLMPEGLPVPMGWSPPQWKAAGHLPCWPISTPLWPLVP